MSSANPWALSSWQPDRNLYQRVATVSQPLSWDCLPEERRLVQEGDMRLPNAHGTVHKTRDIRHESNQWNYSVFILNPSRNRPLGLNLLETSHSILVVRMAFVYRRQHKPRRLAQRYDLYYVQNVFGLHFLSDTSYPDSGSSCLSSVLPAKYWDVPQLDNDRRFSFTVP